MAPLPVVVDPNLKRDRLPQPYRLIDKILAEVLDSSFAKIAELESHRSWQSQWDYDTVGAYGSKSLNCGSHRVTK